MSSKTSKTRTHVFRFRDTPLGLQELVRGATPKVFPKPNLKLPAAVASVVYASDDTPARQKPPCSDH